MSVSSIFNKYGENLGHKIVKIGFINLRITQPLDNGFEFIFFRLQTDGVMTLLKLLYGSNSHYHSFTELHCSKLLPL